MSLPDHLRAAYGWTESAGEIDELRKLRGKQLAKYIRESAENFRACEDGLPLDADDKQIAAHEAAKVTESDLRELHDWLQKA